MCRGASESVGDYTGPVVPPWRTAPLFRYLSGQNQFIGNEVPIGGLNSDVVDARVPFSPQRGFAEGFIATSDLISFSYAGKSQVSRTIGMIPGHGASSQLRLDSWN